MARRCGSLSRSLFSAARTIPTRSSSQPSLRSHLLHSRRPLNSLPSTMGPLGCAYSMLPWHTAVASVRLTSRISVESRAFCELSQGT
ncbi:hypothetical protein Lalb_Chr05g0226121 [Lupinus albus]|uniref:Uncharacterized protein n=1 Tax=Lupinus albus TaxID=3870 RepID=A0A6A4QLE9_LUPAL|nr:hypothetical protein Lalb_Chr05g0226121 [Lupinus albus]